jgi:hypothetical protein
MVPVFIRSTGMLINKHNTLGITKEIIWDT